MKEIGAVTRLKEIAGEDEYVGKAKDFFSDAEELKKIQELMKLMQSWNWSTTQREASQQFLKGKVNLSQLLECLKDLQGFLNDIQNFVRGTVAQVKKDAKA